MISLHFVGDGERDAAMIPRLVERILQVNVQEKFHQWARLHDAGRGYSRKLQYAIRQAWNSRVQGVVATVDKDRDGDERFRKLRDTREVERNGVYFVPTALGQADPHAEAWLLDDPVAVRKALELDPAHEIPGVRKTSNPKKSLESLVAISPKAGSSFAGIWAEIARLISLDRCNQKEPTGFDCFAKDVRKELLSLTQSRPAAS